MSQVTATATTQPVAVVSRTSTTIVIVTMVSTSMGLATALG